jgi:hypothetical protein
MFCWNVHNHLKIRQHHNLEDYNPQKARHFIFAIHLPASEYSRTQQVPLGVDP